METAWGEWHREAVSEPTFTVEEVAVGPVGNQVRVEGRLTFEGVGRLREALRKVIRIPAATRIDLSQVEVLDGGAAALLAEVWGDAMRAGAAVSFVGARGPVKSMLDLYTERTARECTRPPPAREPILEQIGRETVRHLGVLRELLEFLGRCFEAAVQVVRDRLAVNWRDVPRLIERHGADGVPIVLLIAFLIGLITSFQAALQLRQFGADSLVADLVSLSITRELGPLMTAIIVAGRSGAAIAAEMGTMRVSEEIDALRALGISPYRFLVFPRVLAIVLVLPFLILLADVVGILGGLLIAITQLEVSHIGYFISVRDALDLWDVMGGAIKGLVFGAIIALTACERGLATSGGAEGVGRSTTSAVVATLFFLVCTDALFSIFFNLVGI